MKYGELMDNSGFAINSIILHSLFYTKVGYLWEA